MAALSSKSILISPVPPPPPRPRGFISTNFSSISNPSSSPFGPQYLTIAGSNHRSYALTSSSPVNSPFVNGNGVYKVGDFMTSKHKLHVVKPSTPVDEALEILVEKRITGFPVIDDDWNLVGVVSDYDLLALDSVSGRSSEGADLFPNVDKTWKTFNQIQKLLLKTRGSVVGDLMTPNPLVVRENTNLDDAARLLLETKYNRLPVVDSQGRLIGIITRGDIVRAALKMKNLGRSSS